MYEIYEMNIKIFPFHIIRSLYGIKFQVVWPVYTCMQSAARACSSRPYGEKRKRISRLDKA